eukprot:SAG22_NODE_33_length_27588_cov_104.174652_26_plen_71_part_00
MLLKAVITAFPSVSLPFLAVPLLSQPTVAISVNCPEGTMVTGVPRELADAVCEVCPDGQWPWARVSCEFW